MNACWTARSTLIVASNKNGRLVAEPAQKFVTWARGDMDMLRPGPQPCNNIAATFEEQLARALGPQLSVAKRRRRRLVRLIRREFRKLLAKELLPLLKKGGQ
jgi:hypothetical protein